MTYADTLERVRRLAARIDALVPSGRPVAIMLPNAAEFPVAALSCFAAGRPYVPIDLDYPAARNAEILREVEAAAAITLPDLSDTEAALISELPRIALNSNGLDVDKSPLPAVDPDSPAVILYTSGSTGRPKGICNSQSAILHRVASFDAAARLDPDDRFVVLSSPSTIAGLFVPMTTLLSGATLRVVELRRVGLDGLSRIMRDERVTAYWSVPVVLRALLSSGREEAVASLRLVRLGGDVLFERDLAQFRQMLRPDCQILIGFGSTEVPTTFLWFAQPGLNQHELVPSGHIVPGIGVALVDDVGQAVARGKIGELVVRSRHLALGLWQDGQLTPGPFATDPDERAVRILRTGDLMQLREDGLFAHHGRKDRQVKINGVRVDPGEVEVILRGCPGVADAAVIAREDSRNAIRLIAFVAGEPGVAAPTTAAVAAVLAQQLPAAKLPTRLHVVEAIPRLPGFKIDVGTMADLDLRREGEVAPLEEVPAATVVEAAVKKAWGAIFGRRSAARNRRWDEAGGDSLSALQLLLRLEEVFGRRLPTDLLTSGMTVASLAAAISAHVAAAPVDREPADGDDRRPAVFVLPGISGNNRRLARFCYLIRDRVRFIQIDYPDWREAIAAKGDFAAIVDAVVDQILRQGDDEPLYLIGYSFGGWVAVATARRLAELGQEVAFLGLLDSRRLPESWLASAPPLRRAAAIARAEFHAGGGALFRCVYQLLIEIRAFRVLALVARPWLSLVSAGRSASLRVRLLEYLRTDALAHWAPIPIGTPTVLFRSEEAVPDLPQDYGWGAICRRFRLVLVSGDHRSMLDDPLNPDRLPNAFLAALHEHAAPPAHSARVDDVTKPLTD